MDSTCKSYSQKKEIEKSFFFKILKHITRLVGIDEMVLIFYSAIKILKYINSPSCKIHWKLKEAAKICNFDVTT